MSSSLLQCGIDNNCLTDIIQLTKYFFNTRTKIIHKITSKLPIDPELINELQSNYDILSKKFFSQKTIKCLTKYCKEHLPDVLSDFQKMLNIANHYRTQIIKHSMSQHNRVYILLLDTIIKIINDFSHKYKTKYLGQK